VIESISRTMNRCLLNKSAGTIFLLGIFLISACDKTNHQETGYLEGVISIGPICPVERIPPDPGCLPTAETYKAYPVGVFTTDGNRKVGQLNPSLDGTFSVEVPAGNYLVVLEKAQNNIGGSNLPVVISIISRDTTLLRINIDTGIR
jgi:hypothetical protein